MEISRFSIVQVVAGAHSIKTVSPPPRLKTLLYVSISQSLFNTADLGQDLVRESCFLQLGKGFWLAGYRQRRSDSENFSLVLSLMDYKCRRALYF